jgi:phosphopantetheine--protein transferase-like protein
MIAEVRRLLSELDAEAGVDPRADFGVGVDVEEVARWQHPVAGLFTEVEHVHCRRMARPAESYAGRWCAKEAVLKALAPFVAVSLRDIEIRSGRTGIPEPLLLSSVSNRWSGLVRVSIAHSPSVAIAVAVAVPSQLPSIASG